MNAYLLLAVLLGTNMLIALMAKTFDVIYEQQGVNFMYLRARTCMSWDEAPLVCSPIIILAWPALLVNNAVGLISNMVGCQENDSKEGSSEPYEGQASTAAHEGLTKRGGSTLSLQGLPQMVKSVTQVLPEMMPVKQTTRSNSPIPSNSPQKERRDGEKNDSKRMKRAATRSMLTSVGTRPSQDESNGDSGAAGQWSRQQQAEICGMLLNWILDHEDEVNQNERWRTQMQKKNAKRFDKVDRAVNNVIVHAPR